MLGGSYLHRSSPLHRAPAGVKLAGLAVAAGILLAVRAPLAVVLAAVVVLVLYRVARVGLAAAWAQVRPLRWFVPVILVVQLVVADPATAVSLTARLVLMVALAGLVTLTTRTSELMASAERWMAPLRRFGLDPARVSLLMSLAIRSVPVVAGIAARVREAQQARGHERQMRAFAVPVVVGVLRQADALGDALRARGMDD